VKVSVFEGYRTFKQFNEKKTKSIKITFIGPHWIKVWKSKQDLILSWFTTLTLNKKQIIRNIIS